MAKGGEREGASARARLNFDDDEKRWGMCSLSLTLSHQPQVPRCVLWMEGEARRGEGLCCWARVAGAKAAGESGVYEALERDPPLR